MAVEAVLAGVEAEARMAAVEEAHTAAEALAADPKLFANFMARPDLPGGLFILASTSAKVSQIVSPDSSFTRTVLSTTLPSFPCFIK
jgi:hypothetical protein